MLHNYIDLQLTDIAGLLISFITLIELVSDDIPIFHMFTFTNFYWTQFHSPRLYRHYYDFIVFYI